jgi:glycosyltransferase involved in cell wall biosynthesis
MLRTLGIRAKTVDAPRGMLEGSQQPGHLRTAGPALRGLFQWSRTLKRDDFISTADVIYTVAFKAHLAAAFGRIQPTVWHLHEFLPESTGRVWRFLAHRIPRSVIANSAAVARAWQPSQTRASSRLTTILNGVDLERFTPRAATKWIHEHLDIPPSRRLIGVPAVFARWKGHLEIVTAFREIADSIPDVDLVFVGGTIYDTVAEREYGSQLQRLLERERTAPRKTGDGKGDLTRPRVYLLPFQEEMQRVYPEFDVTVHYSVKPEPFGKVIVESMACGVPVIAAAEGGPREILGAESQGGWLVEPRNPDALARQLQTVLRRPGDTLRVVGAVGRRRAEERFDARRFAEEVAAVLRRVVSETSR